MTLHHSFDRARLKSRVESALLDAVGRAEVASCPPVLARAMRYAVFPGGGRMRPLLTLAVAEACGGRHPGVADAVGASLELLHCASLVHDDLPCFDDAATRRGRPSVHRAFGEPVALLVGDALIVAAFEALGRGASVVPERIAPLVTLVASAVGAQGGIIAGQAWESERDVALGEYHRAKTASLFEAATAGGALAAGADPAPWRAVGERLGLAYQVADDLADALSTSSELGKPAHQDEALGRPNAVASLGLDGATARFHALVGETLDLVPACPGRAAVRELLLDAAVRLVPGAAVAVAKTG